MKVPLIVNDFLRRAEELYPDRTAFVDEPDQPAESWGTQTYAEMAKRARAIGAGLDELGIEVGERVAMISHNSARLLTHFFAVSGSGRILVPINYRLAAAEVRYIVEHSGARLLLVDPELDDALSSVTCERRLVIGEDADAEVMGPDVEPVTWAPDEDTGAAINYTSGTTARPKGVLLTHRNIWLNATTFGWHLGITDRDVYLHTLPQFHCNGWGLPYAVTGMGATRIIQRKVDGAEILRRVERHGDVRRPRRAQHDPRRRRRLGRRDPRPRSGPHRRRRSAATDAHDRALRDRARLGSSSRSMGSAKRRRG